MATQQRVPPGTVAVRNYLRAQGVPDELIEWDPQEGVVRVGGAVIRPTMVSGGVSYATPQAIEQAVQAARRLLAPPLPPSEATAATQADIGPPPFAQQLSEVLSAVTQLVPRVQQAASALLPGLPLSGEVVSQLAELTGRLPTGQPTFATQQAVANLFRTLGADLGQFPTQVPSEAGMFDGLLGQAAGRITEERRSNLAREAISRASVAVQAEEAALRRRALEEERLQRERERAALRRAAEQIREGKITTPADLIGFLASEGVDLGATGIGALVRSMEQASEGAVFDPTGAGAGLQGTLPRPQGGVPGWLNRPAAVRAAIAPAQQALEGGSPPDAVAAALMANGFSEAEARFIVGQAQTNIEAVRRRQGHQQGQQRR